MCVPRLFSSRVPKLIIGEQTIADGNITASGRASDDAFWYVIDHSTIRGNGTQTYLGRPWGAFARVVYQYCWLPKSVPAVGWMDWHPE